MSKKDEALKLAANINPFGSVENAKARDAAREALANSALDRMAENARELGLDYAPPCKTGSQCTSKCPQCEQPAQQQEPFGYFKPEPFGWTDCAETDEGAIALYDRPPASKTWVGLTNQELIDLTAIYSGAPLYCAIEAKLREKNA